GVGAGAGGMGFRDGGKGERVLVDGGKRKVDVGGAGDERKDPKKGPPPDPKKVWEEALVKGVDQPGLIIATADYLALNSKWDHAAEFLKANIKQGIVVEPWVYKSLAIALREGGGSAEEIERAEVSAADLEPLDGQGYLSAAKALAEDKHYDRALAFCRQAAILEPGVPHAYADAVGYAEMARDPKAMAWAAGHLLEKDWPVNNADLQAKAAQKVESLARLLEGAKRKVDAERLRKGVQGRQRRDLVVQLRWQGEADLDLKVSEPGGGVCSALSRVTVGGGTLIGDTLDERNAATYVAAEAFSGDYAIQVERVWGKPLGNKCQLKIIRHQGTPEEAEQLVTVRLGSATMKPITVKLEDGRRAETAYVPPAAALE